MLEFLTGLVVGGCLGVFVVALVFVRRRHDPTFRMGKNHAQLNESRFKFRGLKWAGFHLERDANGPFYGRRQREYGLERLQFLFDAGAWQKS